jgi:hypothetical protein
MTASPDFAQMEASLLRALEDARDPKGEELLLGRCPEPEMFSAAGEVVAREAATVLLRELARVLAPVQRAIAARPDAQDDDLDWIKISNTLAIVAHRRVWLAINALFAEERQQKSRSELEQLRSEGATHGAT